MNTLNLRFAIALFWTTAALVVGAYLDWETHQIVLLCLIVWQLIYPTRLGYLVAATLACLVAVPVLEALGRDVRANEVALAVYAGFFLCVATVVLQRAEQYFQERNQKNYAAIK